VRASIAVVPDRFLDLSQIRRAVSIEGWMVYSAAETYGQGMTKVAIIIESNAAPGKRDDLFALYQEHLAPRAEANERQEAVVWCADQQDPDAFILFEIYADTVALAANAGADWFGDYMQKAMPLLAGEPKVTMATPLWSTGV
jgi:quinol monooxygenase YgiN